MYTQADLVNLDKQLKQRILAWLVPEVLLLGLVVYSLVIRQEHLTSLLFALLGAMLLFSMSLQILPVKRYRDFVKTALVGKNTTNVSRFESLSDAPVAVDGVRFYPLMMRVDGPKEAYNQRQFYWDANLPLPQWQQGRLYQLTSHEKAVIAWEEAPLDALTNA